MSELTIPIHRLRNGREFFTKPLKQWKDRFLSHTQQSLSIITLFGIFGFINFTFFYFLWKYQSDCSYDDTVPRISSAILCLFLAVNKHWPEFLKKFLPLYWFGVITFCLPLYGTFAFLMNQGEQQWTLTFISRLFWLVVVLDWFSFMFIFPIGTALGIFFYLMLADNPTYPTTMSTTLIHAVWLITTSILFVRRKEVFNSKRLQSMSLLAKSIAHELRTPLQSISTAANGLQKFLPPLISGYKSAKEAKLPVEQIDPIYLELLNNISDEIEQETRASFLFIDMLLVKLSLYKNIKQSVCSISDCISNALSRYPFQAHEKGLVQWNKTHDFEFRGNFLLITHVLFNLLKNSIFYVQASKKGKIEIWTEEGKEVNFLHFKDTGNGIPSSELPHIFDSFYSTTKHGTGVGLAYCKSALRSIGGDIKCHSEERQYTEFIISLPKIHLE